MFDGFVYSLLLSRVLVIHNALISVIIFECAIFFS